MKLLHPCKISYHPKSQTKANNEEVNANASNFDVTIDIKPHTEGYDKYCKLKLISLLAGYYNKLTILQVCHLSSYCSPINDLFTHFFYI